MNLKLSMGILTIYKISIYMRRFSLIFLKSNTVISLIENINGLVQENDESKIIMRKIK